MDSITVSEDLALTQQAWRATYRALAAADPAGNTPLRRRLLALSVRMVRLRAQAESSGRPGTRAA
jgi:hypothetical protein